MKVQLQQSKRLTADRSVIEEVLFSKGKEIKVIPFFSQMPR
jgi:hypothetical protein